MNVLCSLSLPLWTFLSPLPSFIFFVAFVLIFWSCVFILSVSCLGCQLPEDRDLPSFAHYYVCAWISGRHVRVTQCILDDFFHCWEVSFGHISHRRGRRHCLIFCSMDAVPGVEPRACACRAHAPPLTYSPSAVLPLESRISEPFLWRLFPVLV